MTRRGHSHRSLSVLDGGGNLDRKSIRMTGGGRVVAVVVEWLGEWEGGVWGVVFGRTE